MHMRFTQSQDWNAIPGFWNVQRNLEIAQILRLCGTDICMYIIYQFNSQAEVTLHDE